jgi:hypothetical protein
LTKKGIVPCNIAIGGNMKHFLVLVIFSSFFLTCASAQTNNNGKNAEKIDVLKYAGTELKYEKYLVSVDSYTTNGSVYHKKYLNYLYGIAKIFIDEKKIDVSEKSIGFYYDKKEKRKDKLFIGVDLVVPEERIKYGDDYIENARALIGQYLMPTMNVLSSCTDILKEDEVKGVVVGLAWTRNGMRQVVNIWISKDDMELYYADGLTLNELVIRSTVTNTEGGIIRMTL